MMYEVLISHLRECAKLDPIENTFESAADAIEELSIENADLWKSLRAGAELVRKQRKQEWIPVTERLPDTMKDKSVYSGWSEEIAPSDDVLCYLGNKNRQTVAWYSHTYKEWTTVDENTVYNEEVTHWMPLPAPPKEES